MRHSSLADHLVELRDHEESPGKLRVLDFGPKRIVLEKGRCERIELVHVSMARGWVRTQAKL